MIKEGVIRFVPITIEDCEKEKNGTFPSAITNNGKIVAITKYDKANNMVMVSVDGREPILIALNAVTPFDYRPLNYPVVQHWTNRNNNDGGDGKPNSHILVTENIPVEVSLWQFIIDNRLENVKIEFDDSESAVSKITLFQKPSVATLTKIWKIKMTLFQTYNGLSQQISQYLDKDYATYEEAERELPEIASQPHMDIDQDRQCYFNIEPLMKRQEYVKDSVPQ